MSKVSVIMANYNTKVDQLQESVYSILNQTHQDLELIIVDDHSTDESIIFLRQLSDDRVLLIENDHNLGLTKSLNIAICKSRGEYIARMDSDDVSDRMRIEKQIKYLENHPQIDFVCSWFRHFDGDCSVYNKTIPSTSLFRCYLLFGNSYIAHPSVVYRSSFLKINNLLYDENIKKSQDYDMWIRCTDVGKVATVPEILLNYRIHSKQITTTSSSEQSKYTEIIRRHQLNRLDIFPSEEELRIHEECYNGYSISSKHVQWLYYLIHQNEKKGIYDNSSFRKTIKRVLVKFAVRSFVSDKRKLVYVLRFLPFFEKIRFVIEIITNMCNKVTHKRVDLYL